MSLAQIFLLHFNLRFPTLRSFEKVAPILSVCLAALYPLTLLEIYYSINSLHTDHFLHWDEFLQRFKVSDMVVILFFDLVTLVLVNTTVTSPVLSFFQIPLHLLGKVCLPRKTTGWCRYSYLHD